MQTIQSIIEDWEETEDDYYTSDIVLLGDIADDDFAEFYYVVMPDIDTGGWVAYRTVDAAGDKLAEVVGRAMARCDAMAAAEHHAEEMTDAHDLAEEERYYGSAEYWEDEAADLAIRGAKEDR